MRRRWLLISAIAAVAAVAAVVVVVVVGGGSSDDGGVKVAPAFTPDELNVAPAADWNTASGSYRSNRHSTLTEITPQNVNKLKVAWSASFNLPKTLQNAAFGEEASPIVHDGVAYIADAWGNTFAFDGATGKQLWKYTGLRKGKQPFFSVSRGVGLGDGKVFQTTQYVEAIALDQKTGKLIWKKPIGSLDKGDALSAPPFYYNGLVIFGVSGSGALGGRGRVVALKADTGEHVWTWYTRPGPGEDGYTKGDMYDHGGAIWIYPSADPKLNQLYISTGNPWPWNERGPGDDKWTSSVVALRPDTGKFVWGYQTVHHDIWDYDVTGAPVLFDAEIDGRMRTGMAVTGKTGYTYILDRATGKPLLPIPEVKVPQLKNAYQAKYANTSPTQPEPVGDPLVSQCAPKSEWTHKAPDGYPYKVSCIFEPYGRPVPGQGSTVAVAPAPTGKNWPPSSLDPKTNTMYVCASETNGFGLAGLPKSERIANPKQGSLYQGAHGSYAKRQPKNPGRIISLNVTTNRINWKITLESACWSGVVTTDTGVGFFGQIKPNVLTAFDTATGKILWNSPDLKASVGAPPVTYEANGKQYVIVVTGNPGSGSGFKGFTSGDEVYAFELP